MAQDVFYGEVIKTLRRDQIPFLIGGTNAIRHYTGIQRESKDLDLFLREVDIGAALLSLARAGYRSELVDPVWLGKVFQRDGATHVDLIFSSGNGLCRVDDVWFHHARQTQIYGETVSVIPPEEMIFSKAFIMARDRFDGADINHLVLVMGPELDWHRLIRRFDAHWAVIFSHLMLFQYVYPGQGTKVPPWVWKHLREKFDAEALESPVSEKRTCRGYQLDRISYQVDMEEWGYRDQKKTA